MVQTICKSASGLLFLCQLLQVTPHETNSCILREEEQGLRDLLKSHFLFLVPFKIRKFLGNLVNEWEYHIQVRNVLPLKSKEAH
jgi:hypothetical protein